ncbi:MAG: DapH/DapD/GlmU-related protein [Spirochaetales bacterium]|uniref:DapH/DapD/GlmU-related protein n=1 Tax=Candidatus Thalassospirochaeta sargassi TaxID=3119039 RepID=A0AAJ1IDG7_9SPIO|nr:DapH/DapD/GlmU-related protein [Spirochaetales bacterium]
MGNNHISDSAKIINSNIGEYNKIFHDVEVRNSKIGDYVSLGDQTILLNCEFDSNIAINRRNFIQQSHIGKFTYTGVGTQIRGVEIGNFCSISWYVSIGGKNHNYNYVTNSTRWAFKNMYGGPKDTKFIYGEGHAPCILENDVWIAANAVIMRGVKLGNGCVIGAGAVVTKDVEPYSIVAGSPAKKINQRFDDKIIDSLEKIQWWNWDKDVIKNNLDLIYSSQVDGSVIGKLAELSKSI